MIPITLNEMSTNLFMLRFAAFMISSNPTVLVGDRATITAEVGQVLNGKWYSFIKKDCRFQKFPMRLLFLISSENKNENMITSYNIPRISHIKNGLPNSKMVFCRTVMSSYSNILWLFI